MDKEVLVSVLMLVYNHEPYIAQAIEGVLMQKTTFKYELIIGEDCSTDKSRTIIREYQKRYPDIIRPVYWKRNVGGKKNANMIRSLARGKYIALCEGDDYWCDERKLQKQIDFLEENPQYSGVYHNVCCVDERGRKCKRRSIAKYPHKGEQSYTFEMVKGMRLVGQSAGVVHRNLYKNLSKKQMELFHNCDCNGDHKLCAVLSCIGKIYYMEDEMACHRVVLKNGSSWSAQTCGRNMQLANYKMYMALCKLIKEGFDRSYISVDFEKGLCKNSVRIARSVPNLDNVWICLQVLCRYISNRCKEWKKFLHR